MSFKTNHITDQFKRTYIRCNSVAEKTRAQELMFKLGFKWATEDRKIRNYGQERAGCFCVNAHNRITYGYENMPHAHAQDYREITVYDLRQAVDAYTAIRKAKKKDQRRRKSLAGQGWIKNEGMKPDVAGDVDIMFKNGEVRKNVDTDWNWDLFGEDYAISFYKAARSVEAKVAQPAATTADKDGFISWTGEGYVVDDTTYSPGGMHGPVIEGTRVDVKLRSGEVCLNEIAGMGGNASGWYWVNEGCDNDIVAYRLCPTVTVGSLSAINAGTLGTLTVSGVLNPGAGDWSVDAEGKIDTNPKRQFGMASIPLNLWSPLASAYGAVSLYNGSLKYGRGNYKATPVEASIYVAAAMRHLAAWAEGEEFDPADGCPNLGGVLANIAILLDARASGTLIDDRQLPSGYLKERDALKEIVRKLQDVHAGKDPRHYTIADAK